jgi:hypothetical protein
VNTDATYRVVMIRGDSIRHSVVDGLPLHVAEAMKDYLISRDSRRQIIIELDSEDPPATSAG